MNRIVSEIGVDAGMIMVADLNYLKTVKHDFKEINRLGKIITVPKGIYSVNWRIRKTSMGDIQGKETLKVTSGRVFICDPCYVIGKPEHKDWLAWLNVTDYGRVLNNDQTFIIDEMGGDGCYDIELDFTLDISR
jgi:hypothetical protein